jgi:hypothetical protein
MFTHLAEMLLNAVPLRTLDWKIASTTPMMRCRTAGGEDLEGMASKAFDKYGIYGFQLGMDQYLLIPFLVG